MGATAMTCEELREIAKRGSSDDLTVSELLNARNHFVGCQECQNFALAQLRQLPPAAIIKGMISAGKINRRVAAAMAMDPELRCYECLPE
jgi:hypothetical protein